eukprot:755558-Hanusia_phi.AAC.2
MGEDGGDLYVSLPSSPSILPFSSSLSLLSSPLPSFSSLLSRCRWWKMSAALCKGPDVFVASLRHLQPQCPVRDSLDDVAVAARAPVGDVLRVPQHLPRHHPERPDVALLPEPPAVLQCFRGCPTDREGGGGGGGGGGGVEKLVVWARTAQAKICDLDVELERRRREGGDNDVPEGEIAMEELLLV